MKHKLRQVLHIAEDVLNGKPERHGKDSQTSENLNGEAEHENIQARRCTTKDGEGHVH
jgi:hypothetical protein